MSIVAQSTPHQQQLYRDNVMMVAQQVRNRFREAITTGPAVGEALSAADLVASVEAIEETAIERRNVENNPNLSRRWLIFPNRLKSGQYIDKAEKLQKTQDPTSIYVTTHTRAVERAIGDKILGVRYISKGNFEMRDGGILGAAVDGKTPGGSKIALPSECYSLPGGVGLTVDKLIEAKERLMGDDFGLEDDDMMYCAIGPKEVSDLLRIADGDGASLNAFEQKQLMDGKPTRLMGLMWIVTNRLPVDGNGDRMCPVWSKNNIVAGIWQDIQGAMWNDSHADNTPYVRVDAFWDVVRVQDLGVHVIPCVES